MSKSRYIIYLILLALVCISTKRILDICVLEASTYSKQYDSTVNREFSGPSAPRGRILDTNGKILVDNIGVNTVIYNKTSGITSEEEINISKSLAEILEIEPEKITESRLKTFYLKTHDNGKNLITDKEYELLKMRKLSTNDIEALKNSRITESMLNSLSENDKKASFIYYTLSKGYSYQNKIIKKDITDEQVAKINDLNLKGVKTVLTWSRTYPYQDELRSIFGSISNNTLPKELKDYYLEKGLSLDSTVGVSGLEYQYDDYLRGVDAKYHVSQDGTIKLIDEEKSGSDLYLSIDIDIQQEVENILKSEMLEAKKAKNTEYYNHSYVLVGHPKTGEIVAMSGLQISEENFIDISGNIINSSYTVGSIVKGGSMSVGYDNNLVEKGKYVTDSCVKVYGVQSHQIIISF